MVIDKATKQWIIAIFIVMAVTTILDLLINHHH